MTYKYLVKHFSAKNEPKLHNVALQLVRTRLFLLNNNRTKSIQNIKKKLYH
jgi:hypothetical protein